MIHTVCTREAIRGYKSGGDSAQPSASAVSEGHEPSPLKETDTHSHRG
jgi:hypothetical protein